MNIKLDLTLFQIDQQATAKAPWKVGQIIAKEERTVIDNLNLYKVFLGVTVQNQFVIQDLYATGEKFTDPYLATCKCDKNKSLCNWLDFRAYGLFISWFINGQKKEEGFYQDNQVNPGCQKHGLWTQWYINGQKRNQELISNGCLDGISEHWYANGQKQYECYFRNGRAYGTWASWHENGLKSGEGRFLKGRYGIWIYWDERGNKYCEKHYDEYGKLIYVWGEQPPDGPNF